MHFTNAIIIFTHYQLTHCIMLCMRICMVDILIKKLFVETLQHNWL